MALRSAASVVRVLPRFSTFAQRAAPTPGFAAASSGVTRSVFSGSTFARAFSAGAEAPVEERVIKAVQRYAAMRKKEVTEAGGDQQQLLKALETDVTTATKWEELGFDELDKVEVLLEVEDEFNLTIPDDDADAIQSVDQTVGYLQKQKL
mmetsp:Transcript_68838/g.149832  ORF Transcript_68838/g.149832 Transcript_68838/m.149832 type:complete len:150 (-) Transcript_68838:77-526(-)|eukprot:CAMPEP_0170597960 /NCGR_PEP_ID=MMETSP0224-20130122/15988_1 /TAXON_ID=285029 /ORGANISM="Togula jolla, Strain CCCM 725" /LENGTH=149 /DNA_ID=CAMNT_0010922471 /DNA_START=37 /DNA_END=486 /DNA_ORIENTATION=-